MVDGNYYLYRAWHVLHTDNDIGKALAHLFLSMVCKDAAATKATHLLVAFDGDSFRYNVYAMYKSERKLNGKNKSSKAEGSKEIYTYLTEVKNYLTEAGITWIQPKDYEADDVGAACAAIATDNIKVIIGTKDKDSYQLLNTNVKMYNSSAKPNPVYITEEKAEKAKGVPIKLMIDYQTLLGDKIDSIPGFTGYGPDKVKKTLMKFGSIKKWLLKGSKEDKRWITENKEDLRRNRKLVTLVKNCVDIDIDELKVPKLKGNNNKFPKAWHIYQSFLYPKSKGLF